MVGVSLRDPTSVGGGSKKLSQSEFGWNKVSDSHIHYRLPVHNSPEPQPQPQNHTAPHTRLESHITNEIAQYFHSSGNNNKMAPGDDSNTLARWFTRVRQFGALRKTEEHIRRVAWVVQPKLLALRKKWQEVNEGVQKMEEAERKKHGWEKGQEPPEPFRPWRVIPSVFSMMQVVFVLTSE